MTPDSEVIETPYLSHKTAISLYTHFNLALFHHSGEWARPSIRSSGGPRLPVPL